MAGVNKFLEGTLAQGTISQYYPADDFVQFVFQAMLSGEEPDNRYYLFAYVEKTDGPPISLGQLPNNNNDTFNAHTVVQFANMNLDADGLSILYPNGVDSDLPIKPTGYYPPSPNYLVYTAGPDFVPEFGGNPYQLNPSPPA
jgi:hypothetical protein